MTLIEQNRLAQIRKENLKHEAMGADVSTWESTFFLNLIDKQNEEFRRMRDKGEPNESDRALASIYQLI